MTRRRAARWIEAYLAALRSNAPADIESLFTPDAVYFTAPYALARAAGDHPRWLGRADDRGDWDFRYEVLQVTDDAAYVRGWTIYEYGVVGNLWVVRFAREQRCRSFTEWCMVEDA